MTFLQEDRFWQHEKHFLFSGFCELHYDLDLLVATIQIITQEEKNHSAYPKTTSGMFYLNPEPNVWT